MQFAVSGLMQNGVIDLIPLWCLFIATVLILYGSWQVGYRFGEASARKGKKDSDRTAATVATAILPLSAFILGFTFNMASGHFHQRRDVLIEEVNTIETAALRADAIAEPERSQLKRLFREYVDAKIEQGNAAERGDSFEHALAIQHELWSQTMAAAEKDRSAVAATLINAMNQMIDMHTERFTVMRSHRIPDMICISLLVLTALGIMALGYQNGVAGTVRTFATIIVTLTFSVVIFLIVDLDRPGGMVNVDQQPLINLQKAMSH